MTRRDAEILYIRKIFPEYKKFREGKNDPFKLLHPRYETLAEYYGLPEDLNSDKRDDKSIKIILKFEDRRIVKELPRDMKVSHLHMLCKRSFGLRLSSDVEITCHDMRGGINYPLDREGQTLHFFSVENDNVLEIKQVEDD